MAEAALKKKIHGKHNIEYRLEYRTIPNLTKIITMKLCVSQFKSSTTSCWSTYRTRAEYNISRIWIWRWRFSNVIRYRCFPIWYIHIDIQFWYKFTRAKYVYVLLPNKNQYNRRKNRFELIYSNEFHFRSKYNCTI